MANRYQARWVSKDKAHDIKRAGPKTDAVLLDTFKGIIIVEPVGKKWGDGPVLTPSEAEFELQPAWHYGPTAKIREARIRMGFDPKPAA